MNELLRRMLFLPPQGSTLAAGIDALHYFVILTTIAGALLVTLAGGVFLILYRRRTPDVSRPHADVLAKPAPIFKIASLSALVVLFLVWWIIGVRQYMTLRTPPPGAMEVYVTAKQWMWQFSYPEGARSISVLYVPAGRPVKLIMSSRDVIHSFYVPDFRLKQDVLPGRTTITWFEVKQPGAHQILCAEYCGAGHSVMRGDVVALAPADFDRWLDEGEHPTLPGIAGERYVEPAVVGQASPARDLSLVRLGEDAAARLGCLRCHSLDGSPHIGPTWAGLYDSVVPLQDGGEVVADEAYITESIMDPMVKIHRGYLPVMPSFMGRAGPGEIAAIVELIKSLRAVRPEDGAGDAQGRGERIPVPRPEAPGGGIGEIDGGKSP